MTETFAELIDRANDIQVSLGDTSYQLNHHETGSYVEFRVTKIDNLPMLMGLAGGLKLKMFGEEGYILVRLFESDNE